jgi:RNA polymerase sigma-70 factor, ECF subfamily
VPVRAPTVTVDDSSLVERCRRGDSAAMETLILKYQNRLFNTILRICANPEDAAELTQETFVKVIEGLGRFQGKSSFYTWAFRIAVNLAINHCQRHKRVGFRSLDSEETTGDEGAAQLLKDFLRNENAPDPASVAQNKELCEMVGRALMELDETHRTVIVLRDIEGMNYAQIAQVVDVELGTVRSRLSRARGSLKEILESMLR